MHCDLPPPSVAAPERLAAPAIVSRQRPSWTPPVRDGVSASRLVLGPGPWASLADFLTARLRSGIDWHARMARGEVLDAQGCALRADAPCTPGLVLWY